MCHVVYSVWYVVSVWGWVGEYVCVCALMSVHVCHAHRGKRSVLHIFFDCSLFPKVH